eukprot:GHVT01002502.1.p1 GENE.GHVT01002502.1~~GHVT01002502.1.p1  ORF type:complete len:502 (+),score=72.71 GHVT01002502.1:3880-5385(+)
MSRGLYEGRADGDPGGDDVQLSPYARASYSRNTPPQYITSSAHTASAFRLRLPLHYHLRRMDIVAVLAELGQGTNPEHVDHAGRNALDLALQLLEEQLETCLCTSLPLDSLGPRLERAAIFGNSSDLFLSESKAGDSGSALEQRAQRLRYHQWLPTARDGGGLHSAASAAAVARQLTRTEKERGATHNRISAQDGGPSTAPGRHTNDAGKIGPPPGYLPPSPENLPASFPLPNGGGSADGGTSGSSSGNLPYECIAVGSSSAEDACAMQNAVLLVVEDALLESPLSSAVVPRMQRMLQKLKSLALVVRKLCANPSLLQKAREITCPLLFKFISYPYLYVAALHTLFRMYPVAPNGRVWEPRNPADSRRLVNIVLEQRLRGHEVFRFLGSLSVYFLELCRIFGASSIFPPSSSSSEDGERAAVASTWDDEASKPERTEVAQYLLHFAFVVDAPKLFHILAQHYRHFFFQASRDIFNWEELLYELVQVLLITYILPRAKTKLT